MNRRASLPGIDELFGSGESRHPDRQDESPDAAPSDPPDRGGRPDPAVAAIVRRLTAPEDETLRTTRDEATGTVAAPIPEVGSLLRWIVRTFEVRTAVEVGAAGGVTGLWLLAALPERGVLTSVEPDPQVHALAKDAFQRVGAGSRVRAILGEAGTVLPRLADASYDLVLLQGPRADYPEDLAHARRLLRPGGVLVARGVLEAEDHDAVAHFLEGLVEDPAFDLAALPVDDGVAIATRRPTDS